MELSKQQLTIAQFIRDVGKHLSEKDLKEAKDVLEGRKESCFVILHSQLFLITNNSNTNLEGVFNGS
jgi:hypothetical protein